MDEDTKLKEIARQIKNQKAKEWRLNNKDKIKEINKRYRLKKAKEKLAEEEKREEI